MAVLRIATTRQQDLQPLSTAGQNAAEAWSTLTAWLTRELSAAHAQLFAEPVVNAARGETDWYADGDGPAAVLTALEAEAQQTVRAELTRLITDLQALVARKRGSGTASTASTGGERMLGEILALAIQLPDEAFIHVRDAKPILVAWGHARAGASTGRVPLTGRLTQAPTRMVILPPPRLPGPAGLARSWFLGALAGAALLPLLALLVLWRDPLGWFVVTPPQCQLAPDQPALLGALGDATAREAALRLELARLTSDAGRRRLQCPPEIVEAARPPAPPPRPPSADARRAEERGGKAGKLQIILAWEDRNDLDLKVICPGGGQINYSTKQNCGGSLDVDANGDTNTSNATPVENVYFNEPPPGRYVVIVDAYAMRVATQSAYRVTIRRDGQPDQVLTRIARNGQRNEQVTEFEVTPPDIRPAPPGAGPVMPGTGPRAAP